LSENKKKKRPNHNGKTWEPEKQRGGEIGGEVNRNERGFSFVHGDRTTSQKRKRQDVIILWYPTKVQDQEGALENKSLREPR